VFYVEQSPRLDFAWVGPCMLGAVYLVFRGHAA
jgi:uncharacterized protein (DUF486 family)